MRSNSIIVSLSILSVVFLSAATAHAQEEGPLSTTTPGSRYVTVTKGPEEPESIGSYALRLYRNSNPDFPADEFIAGVVLPRDGSLLPLEWQDVTGDGEEELIVRTESAGSGSYVSADAFSLGESEIVRVASASGLEPDADVVSALKESAE